MGRRKRFLVGALVSILLVFALGACRQEPVVPALPPNDDAPITTARERYTPEDFLDTEVGRLFVVAEVTPELERLVRREVAVDVKLVEERDGRGPHHVLLVGVVREE